VLSKTYLTKIAIRKFLATVINSKNIAGDDPCAFWKGVKFLDLQMVGNSQRDILVLLDVEMRRSCGLSLADCGDKPHTYVYLDDALYSGGRIKSDLIAWIKSVAPQEAKIAVITIALHQLGEYFASKDIAKAATDTGKKIAVTWWRSITVEDRKAYTANSDVLRPTVIPADADVQAYVANLGVTPVLRTGSNVGPLALFSSDASRSLLEQEFLKVGVQVRKKCTHLNEYMRPLGCSLMKTTGFGSTIVTYRNCANNTPLVFWAGDPWYPLFPRKTN
jgi:hypothetical protein